MTAFHRKVEGKCEIAVLGKMDLLLTISMTLRDHQCTAIIIYLIRVALCFSRRRIPIYGSQRHASVCI